MMGQSEVCDLYWNQIKTVIEGMKNKVLMLLVTVAGFVIPSL